MHACIHRPSVFVPSTDVTDTDTRALVLFPIDLPQLFLDQVEFADVILLSKVPILLAREGEREGHIRVNKIKGLLAKLNPNAGIITCHEPHYADLDTAATLINTGLFDMEAAQKTEAWEKEMNAVHVPGEINSDQSTRARTRMHGASGMARSFRLRTPICNH